MHNFVWIVKLCHFAIDKLHEQLMHVVYRQLESLNVHNFPFMSNILTKNSEWMNILKYNVKVTMMIRTFRMLSIEINEQSDEFK